MEFSRVLVIIPAYNEEESIGGVIRNIKQYCGFDIIVINDGSKDMTEDNAVVEGVRVINLPFNLGIGGAMQTGYMFARDNNYDIAVQIDADGQHDSMYIKKLIKPIVDKESDMVIGSRYLRKTSYRSSISRRIGMLFFSFLFFLLSGRVIKDTTSGYRCVNKELINYFSDNYPADYPEVDVLIRLYKKNYRVKEIPVEMKKRFGGSSSITPIKSMYYMLKVSVTLFINSVRNGEMV